jgi:hypothetical protein
MLTTSGFSSTTTSKVGQIRRMPSCRWEGTVTTVKRRGCKLKLRARLATGIVPVSAAKHSKRFQTLKFQNVFQVNQHGAIHEKCLAVRNAGVSHRFAPSHLYLPLDLQVFTEKMPLHPYPFTEALSRSTLLRPFACRSQPMLRSASHGNARPSAGSAADHRQPPATTTSEPAPTSPDLWPS